MVLIWEPGTRYELNSVVEYQGHRYKIIQPHTSQSDWAPDRVPALWGRLPEEAGHEKREHHHQQEEPRSWNDSQQPQKVEIPHEEQKKKWYDLDDHRKKQLEVGGGLAIGAALLGAGYAAYHHHEKSEEEKKAHVWELQNWVQEAQRRTEEFHTRGPTGPTTWILTHGQNIPEGAIVGGEHHGRAIYIARAYYEGGIQVGKAGPQFEKGGVIGYGHNEIHLDTYEILIGDSRAIRWVSMEGKLKPGHLRLVEGGHEKDGTRLYVAQGEQDNGICPGKASEHLDGALLPNEGTEKRAKHYKVLAYA